MVDRLTPDQRRLNMRRVRAKDTKPEMTVRRLLHGQGFRFRVHRRDLPGRPDIILPRHGAAVFVHGCFWHGHGCSLFRLPATRTEFWSTKIEGNRARDVAAVAALKSAGWRSLWVWECALRGKNRLTAADVSDALAVFILGDARFAQLGERGCRGHDDEGDCVIGNSGAPARAGGP